MEIADVITLGQEQACTVGTRRTAAGIAEPADPHRRLLTEPVTCVLAATSPSGRAQLTPTWCDLDEDDPTRGPEASCNIDELAASYLGQSPYPLRDPGGGEPRVPCTRPSPPEF
jgi:hypothetical protein